MVSDNIPQISGGILVKFILLPGLIFQWLIYMGLTNVGSGRGYAKVRSQTRISRSPIMTWVYSIAAWGVLILLLVQRFA